MKRIYWLLSVVVLIVAVFLWIFTHQAPKRTDEYYMELAVQQARHNTVLPYGGVIVDNTTGEVLGEGFNRTSENPTFHGEMVAIHDCNKKHPHTKWENTTLYTTAEPCPMCQSAIIFTGISRVVYGTSMEYIQARAQSLSKENEQINIRAADVISKAPFYKGTLTGGVLVDKTNELFSKARKTD